MYLGDLKKEALSFSYLGEMTLLVSPDFRAFQGPAVGEVTVCPLYLLTLSPYNLLELWLIIYELYFLPSYALAIVYFSYFLTSDYVLWALYPYFLY